MCRLSIRLNVKNAPEILDLSLRRNSKEFKFNYELKNKEDLLSIIIYRLTVTLSSPLTNGIFMKEGWRVGKTGDS